MLAVLPFVLLGQLVTPPLAQPPLSLGTSTTPSQPYPTGLIGAVAVEGGAIEFLWTDARRSIGESPGSPVFDLWWGRKRAGGAEVVTALIAKGPISSPSLSISGGTRLIAWIDSTGAKPRLEFRTSPFMSPPAITVPTSREVAGAQHVAVTAFDGGHAVAWATSSEVLLTPWPLAGSPTPFVLGSAPNRLAFSQARGRLLVAMETQTGTEFATDSVTTQRLDGVRLAGISPDRDEIIGVTQSGGPMSVVAFSTDGGEHQLTQAQGIGAIATGVGQDTFFVTNTATGADLFGRWGTGGLATHGFDAGEVIAIATTSTVGAVLHRGRALEVSEFDSQTFAPPVTTSIGFAPTMRGPSIAWSKLGAFLVAWDERVAAPDEGWSAHVAAVSERATQLGTATLTQLQNPGATPEVRVSEGAIGEVLLAAQASQALVVARLNDDGGVGPFSTLSRNGWRLSSAPVPRPFRADTTGVAEILLATPTSLPISAPRCAGGFDGGTVFAGWQPSGTEISLVVVGNDGAIGSPVDLPFPAAQGEPICLTRSTLSDEFALTWVDRATVHLVRLRLTAQGVDVLEHHERSDPTGPIPTMPEAVIVPGGMLVAVEQAPAFGSLAVALVQPDGGVRSFPVSGASGLGVRAPHFAVTPTGTTALVWQEFDRALGATRVRARVFVWDAGASIDAGSGDGGEVEEPDAGVDDAGTGDAGQAPDGGSTAGGTELAFVPACSCATPASSVLPLVALLLMLARRMR